MRRLEVRRHSLTKKGSERTAGTYLSAAGVSLARRVGEDMGPFGVVVATPIPRTVETAVAMGFAVDDIVDVGLDDAFWEEVGRHEQWSWDDTFAGYREIVTRSPAVARVGATQRQVWEAVLGTLPDGGAALFVSHGHAIEAGIATCFGAGEVDWTGGPFSQCEGFRCSYADGTFTDAAIQRV